MARANTTAQPKLSAQEKKWQAESDAMTLAEAQRIMADPKRLSAASKEATAMAKEKADAAKALTKVAAKGKKAGGK